MIRKATLLLLFIGISSLSKAESLPDGYQVKQFMIRNASFTSELARSFNIHPNFLKQNNKKLPKILYKGAVINVPIKTKPVEWNPDRYNSNKPFLGPEDARPQTDFEWDNEMIDPLFVEEILSLDEIYGDSVQFEKIKTHINNIDNEVKYINHINDSIKKAEFAFEYDEKDMNAVLKRMEKARNLYYSKTPNALKD
jgi:LysM repeat protein